MKTQNILVLIILVLTLSCSKENDDTQRNDNNDVSEITLPEKSAEVIEASNTFGFDIFRSLLADADYGENIFISPTSISLALGMTLNGANSLTEDSMAYALRVNNLTTDQINATYRDLINGLTSIDEKVLLSIANSIWYRLGFHVENDFLNINSEYYNAEVAALDFNSPDAVNTINNWVAEHTNNKIHTIIDEIDPDQIMFLINAIYFKGIWKKEFNPESTYDGDFYLTDGTTKTVRTMAIEEEIGYLENDIFQACELDYGNGNYSMVILLPNSSSSVEMICQNLSTESWKIWMQSITSRKVKLTLPKLKFGYEKRLDSALMNMGMGIAFDPLRADFTGINADGGIYIGLVKHKTFIEVNEEGTEAAAVTVVGMEYTSISPDETTSMFVNRPFVFAIREKTTGAIVFIGKVSEPVMEEK